MQKFKVVIVTRKEEIARLTIPCGIDLPISMFDSWLRDMTKNNFQATRANYDEKHTNILYFKVKNPNTSYRMDLKKDKENFIYSVYNIVEKPVIQRI